MKKAIMFLVTVLTVVLCGVSLAEEANSEILDVLNAAGIQNPVQLSQWGDTGACFAETDGVKHLIVLERHDTDWEIVIDNPTALIQEWDWPELYSDTDTAIYWEYNNFDGEHAVVFSSWRDNGIWGNVDAYISSGADDYAMITAHEINWKEYAGGELLHTIYREDENGNIASETSARYPAAWLADCSDLAEYNVKRFPSFGFFEQESAAPDQDFLREAAAALMPEYTFIKGLMKNDAMHFLMEKPDGTRVYVICEYQSHREVRLIESTPLPEGTALGYENFTDSLWIDGRCVTIHLLYNGNAGIEYIYNDSAYPDETGGFLFFGDRTIWDGSEVSAQTILYGDHPWDDITQIDWNRLPHTLEEASLQMDSSNYAMVVNPNPADRLHLRERADKGSRSQGKYYTATPVTIGGQEGDWTQVIFGDWRTWSHGYMMKRYLTFGQPGSALRLDLSAMPQLFSKDGEMLKVYDEAQAVSLYTYHQNEDHNTMKVIGIIGDEWYHIWFPATGEYGFVRQSDLWSGNG